LTNYEIIASSFHVTGLFFSQLTAGWAKSTKQKLQE